MITARIRALCTLSLVGLLLSVGINLIAPGKSVLAATCTFTKISADKIQIANCPTYIGGLSDTITLTKEASNSKVYSKSGPTCKTSVTLSSNEKGVHLTQALGGNPIPSVANCAAFPKSQGSVTIKQLSDNPTDAELKQLEENCQVKGSDYHYDKSTKDCSLKCSDDQTSEDGKCSDGDVTITCGKSTIFSGFPVVQWGLNWLFCTAITGMTSITASLENEIVGYLCINTTEVFGADTSSGNLSSCDESSTSSAKDSKGKPIDTAAAYKQAWNVFRILALGLLAITALIMILSQTSGFDFVDAYTIRKVLPRLLIAAIGISLSWPLLQFFVGLVNDLGVGIRALIYAPFHDVGQQAILGGGSASIGAIFGGAYLTSLGAFGILLLIASALLAVLVAFAVLIIRKMLIILLIIFAPIAIVAYVLPNTHKIWSLWWDFFSKALLMFPIITAFIAIGHVFGALSIASNSGLGSQLVGIVAYFAPYFLLPATFRFAGGALATLGGFANDRSRGAFDMLSNKRKAIQADRFKRAQSESLWDKNSLGGLGKYGNKLASWATDPGSNAAYYGRNIPGLKKAGARVAGQIEHAQVEQSRKLFEELNSMGFNDKGFRALNSGLWSKSMQDKFSAAGINSSPSSLADLDKMAHILSQSDDQTERTAGQAIEANRGRLATLYKDPEMTKASTAAAGALGLAAHGFMDRTDLPAAMNELAGKNNENVGFARSIGTQAQLIGVRSRPEIKAGYGLDFKDGKFVSGLDDNGGLRAYEAIGTFNTGDLSGAKAGTFSMDEKGIGNELKFILTQGNSPEAAAASKRIKDLKELARNGDAAANQQLKNIKANEPETFKLATAHDQRDSVLDELAQGIGPYSQAAADTKTAMRDLLIKSDINLDSLRTRGVDPRLLNGGGSGEEISGQEKLF